MAVRRLAPEAIQPANFTFSSENKALVDQIIAKYPKGRQASAVIPLLWQAQKQGGGWLSRAAIEHVAQVLDMPKIRVLEIATFYSMFNLEPVGRYFIQLCGTTPCALRGAEKLKQICETRIGPQRQVTADGKFSWLEVECLGACCNAPMVQINDDFYEDLTPESFTKLLDDLAANRSVKVGPQNGRRASEPEGAVTTLADSSLYDGSRLGKWRERFAPPANDPASLAAQEIMRTQNATAETPSATVASKPPSGTSPPPPRPLSPSTSALKVADTEQPASALASSIGDMSATSAPVLTGMQPATSMTSTQSVKLSDAEAADEAAEIERKLSKLPKGASAREKADAVGSKPAGLSKPRDGKPDDLKRIKGIGRVNEGKLNELGIFHFFQIAAWTRPEIRWVGTYLAFPGRIDRENWIAQAEILARGDNTEFSQRVDRGEVPTSSSVRKPKK